jgi:hypothetical protein
MSEQKQKPKKKKVFKRKHPTFSDHELEVRRAKFLHMLNNPKHCSECVNRFGFMMCQSSHPKDSIRSDVQMRGATSSPPLG